MVRVVIPASVSRVQSRFAINSFFFSWSCCVACGILFLNREKAQISTLLPKSCSSRDQLGFQAHLHFQKWHSHTSRTSRSTTAVRHTEKGLFWQGPPSSHAPLYFCAGPRLLLCPCPLVPAPPGCLHVADASPLKVSSEAQV